MANRIEIGAVYLGGLAQGLALVAVPAAASALTSRAGYGLSAAQYGMLFAPMAAAAVVASAVAGDVAGRWGMKPILLLGLALDFAAMALLVASRPLQGQAAAYGVLLAAMAALGGGFGATLTAVNAYVPAFFPRHAEPALTALHTLLGAGTALAPLLVAILGGQRWTLLPLGVAAALLALLVAAVSQPMELAAPRRGTKGHTRAPARLWAFVAMALIYGICETLLGNWAVPYWHGQRGLTAAAAGVVLAVFWALVTVGRLGVAVAARWLPPRRMYPVLPVLLLVALALIPRVGGSGGAIAVFALAGLGCSALLPLTIAFAEEQFPTLAEALSGELIAVYMIGYGLASFGVAPLAARGFGLGNIYHAAAILALAMAGLGFELTRGSRAKGRAA